MILHFPGCAVHLARAARQFQEKKILRFCRTDAATQNRQTFKTNKDRRLGRVSAFCGGGSVGHKKVTARGIESISGTFTRKIRIIERRELSMPKVGVVCW